MPAKGTRVAASAVIVIGGDPFDERAVPRLPLDRYTIAADSGLDHAMRVGLAVDLVVGDLDSVTPDALRGVEVAGVAIERHPRDKDAIDAELAIDAALARGLDHLVVLGGGGDRVDHALAGLLLLGQPRLAAHTIEGWWGDAHIHVLHGPARRPLTGTAGQLVSLVPLHGPAAGVTTSGLRYPLVDEDLPAGTSRGVSNEFIDGGRPASVTLRGGVLLVIIPYALGGTP
jgi:thiamine pyrophosphokinase